MTTRDSKTYTKTKLAQLYNPYVQPASARRTLRSWIDKNENLKKELALTGYNKNSRIFTPLQVQIVFRHLGAP